MASVSSSVCQEQVLKFCFFCYSFSWIGEEEGGGELGSNEAAFVHNQTSFVWSKGLCPNAGPPGCATPHCSACSRYLQAECSSLSPSRGKLPTSRVMNQQLVSPKFTSIFIPRCAHLRPLLCNHFNSP